MHVYTDVLEIILFEIQLGYSSSIESYCKRFFIKKQNVLITCTMYSKSRLYKQIITIRYAPITSDRTRLEVGWFDLYRGGQFIGGGNRSTRRKPSVCRKSLTNFIT